MATIVLGAATTSLRHRSRIRDVLALARPWFWLVSLVPYYVGFVLASRRLVPSLADLPAVAVGAIVVGPLLWLAVLAVNDAYDLDGDRANPRKAVSPLVTGRVTRQAALRIGIAAGFVAVAAALTVNVAFAAGTIVALVLGWLYSAPPARLKSRPGADVAVNALAIGVFGQLAGWVVLRPAGEFPWAMAALGTLVGIALYLPTTIADMRADQASGYATIAVRLGARRTHLVGLTAWSMAAALSVVLAATGHVLPRSMLALEVVMVPVLIAAYRRFVVVHGSFRGIVIVATMFLVPAVTFALTYTGVW